MHWARRIAIAVLLCAVPIAAAAQTSGSASQQALKAGELDQLVAPVALYPDALLSQVLIASTYPLEVVQADRWVKQNTNLKGDQLKTAADKQSWDQSLKSLVATPSVLDMMSAKLDWTQKLGNAVLAQQADVMDAVQRLRAKADANNQLKTTSQQKVTKTTVQSKQYIVIVSANPNTVYVPYYNPAVVYGAWPYPAYPPYYYTPPGYVAGAAIAAGIAFGAGYAVGRWASGGNYWGGGVNWSNNDININNININNGNIGSGNKWQHNPEHRHGVQYNNDNVRQKYSNNDLRNNSQNRIDFRGRDGQQVLNPSASRPGSNRAANAPTTMDRAGSGKATDASNRSRARDKVGNDRAGNRGGGDAFRNMDRGDAVKREAQRGNASLGGRSPQQLREGGGGGRPQARGGGGGGRRR